MKTKKRARQAVVAESTALAAAPDRKLILAICAVLAVTVLVVYAQTFHYGFIAYDDDQYVYENATVKGGLSAANIAWAMTTFFYANWHPLTWISYLADAQVSGMNAGWFHTVNVLLHAGAAVLLFLALSRMTRQPWRCALVAAIFALHPLRVESVAWISERKDVLSTFLEMVALLLYARYVESRTLRRYLAVAAVFALSLMAKPMLVTFPFVLLLLDVWPLQRTSWPAHWGQIKPLVVEKLPLLAFSAIASVLTFAAQRDYGAVSSLQRIPLFERLANAALGYVAYIGSAIWPTNLGVLYPVATPAAGSALLAAVLLVAITLAALWTIPSRPYLFSGWFWYVGMLVPVIGIVQVGVQSRADRYTYVPMVGLTVAVIWSIGDWLQSRPQAQRAIAVVSGVAIIAITVATYRQIGYWQDSKTLFEHTIAVTKGNYILMNNLGVVLMGEGKLREAEALYRGSLAVSPDYLEAHVNLGHELLATGHMDAAKVEIQEALRLKPGAPMAEADLALIFASAGDYPQAAHYLSDSVRQKPGDSVAQSNLCYILLQVGQTDEALSHCKEALRLQPDLSNGHFNMGQILAKQGRTAEANAEFAQADELSRKKK